MGFQMNKVIYYLFVEIVKTLFFIKLTITYILDYP